MVTAENIETNEKMAQTIGPKIPRKRRGRVNWKLSQIIGVIEKSVATPADEFAFRLTWSVNFARKRDDVSRLTKYRPTAVRRN